MSGRLAMENRLKSHLWVEPVELALGEPAGTRPLGRIMGVMVCAWCGADRKQLDALEWCRKSPRHQDRDFTLERLAEVKAEYRRNVCEGRRPADLPRHGPGFAEHVFDSEGICRYCGRDREGRPIEAVRDSAEVHQRVLNTYAQGAGMDPASYTAADLLDMRLHQWKDGICAACGAKPEGPGVVTACPGGAGTLTEAVIRKGIDSVRQASAHDFVAPLGGKSAKGTILGRRECSRCRAIEGTIQEMEVCEAVSSSTAPEANAQAGEHQQDDMSDLPGPFRDLVRMVRDAYDGLLFAEQANGHPRRIQDVLQEKAKALVAITQSIAAYRDIYRVAEQNTRRMVGLEGQTERVVGSAVDLVGKAIADVRAEIQERHREVMSRRPHWTSSVELHRLEGGGISLDRLQERLDNLKG